nr:unnamed protein product [Callosobruchus chinensis]
MAVHNTSFKEAELIVNNPSYAKITTSNRFDVLKNIDNFPELPPPSTSYSSTLLRKPKSSPNHQKSNSQITKKRKHLSPPVSPTTTEPAIITPSQPRVSRKRSPPTPLPPSNPHRNDLPVNQNELIEQIVYFILQIIQSPSSFDGDKIRNLLSSIINSKADNNSMECISINSDEEY